ncbi:hypothetical protein HTZ77_08500 [Nonomuraea sp. SMC257]|uniref:Uncharacterized protein n=1 Tax=Nonomuraea montanisoli TaxID=2741721 RepID=A0A7Y6I5E9_9ACTN|nr:hypothetical protein [Nonomuraea montanisoli]NUW31463.1 hypothetical protein [Nonomuraea montanisoli]
MTDIDYGLLGIPALPDTSAVSGHADALGTAAEFHGRLQGDGVGAFQPASEDEGGSADATRTYLAGQGGVLPEAGHLSHHAAMASGGVSVSGKTVAWAAGGIAAASVIATLALRASAVNPEGLAVLARARALAGELYSNLRVLTAKEGRVLRIIADQLKAAPRATRTMSLGERPAMSLGERPAIEFRLERAKTLLARADGRLVAQEGRIRTIKGDLADARWHERLRMKLKGKLDVEDLRDYSNGVYRYQPQLNPYLTREEQAVLERHAQTVYYKLRPVGDRVSANVHEAHTHLRAVDDLARNHPGFDMSEVGRSREWADDLVARARQADRDLDDLRRFDFAPQITVHRNPGGGYAEVQPHYHPSGRVWTGPGQPPAYRDIPAYPDIPGV